MSGDRSGRLHVSMMAIFLSIVVVIASAWALNQNAVADADAAASRWAHVWPVDVARFSADPVTAAWERVQDAGSYHFTSDVVQITIPAATITNVGRPSRTEQLYLEGQSDLEAGAVEFQLWSEDGSILDAESGLAVRVADGKSYTRQGSGEWQESSSFSDSIAPEGDFMAYLAAARAITPHAPETRAGITFTRYSFELDGPAFAAYARNQLEAAMRARGELPNGVHFEAPVYYRDMSGDGELWIREDGLPLRQVLNIRFPEQNGERVEAQIKVDFSHFGRTRFVGGEFVQIDPASAGGSAAGVWNALQHQAPVFGTFLSLLLVMALVVLVVRYRRVRTLQAAFSLALIASMLVGPLLSTLHLASFLDTQTARAAEQRTAQSESDMLRELRAQETAPQFKPQQNPVTVASTAPDLLQPVAAAAAPSNAPMGRTPEVLMQAGAGIPDNDGLSDVVEQHIGTNPYNPDSDGDLIPDGVEVAGFTLPSGGQSWYTDPLNYDSNDDGLSDTEEWGDLKANPPVPSDSDGDGTPDLFEDDNDNDGVPDRLDLAPFSAVPSLTDANPFQLTIRNMTEGLPTIVDLQLRPQNPNNLWFAGNVLDWPQDNQGQVQDVDGFTYADYAVANNLAVAANDSFGDLKLTPMLEMRIPTDSANLPSEEILQAYQVLYNDLDATSAEKILYLPVTIVSDQKTGARVAFAARMRYERGTAQETWLNPHELRLVWTVQMLQDLPCTPDDGSMNPTPCIDGYRRNVPQVIHSYTDDWTLTGISVREEHGTKMSVAYEDPAVDGDVKDENALMALAIALQGTFLEGRDCDNPDSSAQVCRGDGQRDLKIEDLPDRFDHTSSNRPAPGDPERLGFTGALDILTVETPVAYESLDWALTQTVTRTQTVLNRFETRWQSDQGVKPLLMYAYETKSRSLSLDARRGLTPNANLYVTPGGGSQLTFDLKPTGVDPAPIQTFAGMKWTPYCSAPGATPTWEICDGVAYWQTLESRYSDGIANAFPDAVDVDVARGRLAMLQLFWLTLAQGVQQAVANQLDTASSPEELLNLNASYDVSDIEIDGLVRSGTTLGKFGAMFIVNRMALRSFEFVDPQGIRYVTLLKNVGSTFNGKESFGTISRLRHLGSGNGILVTGVVLVAGLVATSVLLQQFGNASQQQDGNILLQSLFIGATTVGSIAMPIAATVSATRGATTAGAKLAAATSALTSRTEVVGISRSANGIGALIGVGLTWGFFGLQIASGEIEPGTIAFNVALATTIGTTIYILLLAVLSVTLVGLILVGLLTLFDQFATLFCDTNVVNKQSDGSCFTIGGAFAKAVGETIYSYAPLIKLKDPNMVVVGVPGFNLTNPALGFVAGSQATITLPVTTTVQHKNPQGIELAGYAHYLSATNLARTTFARTLSTPDEAPITANLGEMTGDWITSKNGQWCPKALCLSGDKIQTYKAVAENAVSATVDFTTAGLNRIPPLYLNTGYALPAYECWGVLDATKCEKKSIKGSTSAPFNPFQFDIFPVSVSEFGRTTSRSDGGNALAWDTAFSTLWDADGDGLISSAYNGNDPNDARWDTDGDGLSDAFESDRRMKGVPVSPALPDADGDGLNDRRELQYGTNPANDDTDNDGLPDGIEIAGWTISVAGINHAVRVFPNPARADSDGDGISDKAEWQLSQSGTPADDEGRPYHPNVFNSSPIKVYTAIDGAPGPWYVKPGQGFNYETTVVTSVPLAPGVIDFNVPADFGPVLTPRRLEFDPQTFDGSQTLARSNFLTADPGLATQDATLTSVVRTRLAPTGPANLQWDAFNTAQVNTLSNQRFLTAESFDIRRSDLYLLGTLTSSIVTSGGNGDVWAEVYNEDVTRQVDAFIARREAYNASENPPAAQDFQSAALRGASSHDIACNDDGQCLGVWEKEYCKTIQLNSIRVERKGTENNGIEPLVYFVADPNDTDPTNGGYELIWDAPGNGGNDMPVSQTARTTGFPKAIEVCGPGRIDIYEHDPGTFSYDDAATGSQTTWGNKDFLNGFYVDRDGIDCDTSLNGTDPCPNSSGRDFAEIVKVAQTDGAPDVRLDTAFRSSSSHFAIQGGILNGNANSLDAQPLSIISYNPYGGNNFAPVVASDGQGYLVAHEQAVNGITHILLIHYSSDFSTYNVNRYQIENPRLADEETRSLVMDLVWSGDHYTLAWKFIRDSGQTRMYFDTLDRTGASRSGGNFTLLTSGAGTAGTPEQPARSANGRPVLAYDPFSNSTLLMYTNGSAVRWTRLIGINSFSRPEFLPNFSTAFAPGLAYNPMVNGWLITRPGDAILMNSGLSAQLLAPASSYSGSQDNVTALACPAPDSQPVVNLRFEDFPGVGGSTNALFVDSSIFGRNATCTTGTLCPTSGTPGATKGGNPVGKPASDYAVTFDGVNDQLTFPNPVSDDMTLAFWYKADQGTGGLALILGSSNSLALGISGNGVNFKGLTASATLADGAWHHVVATRASGSGALTIYVDGASVASQGASNAWTPAANVIIGSGVGNRVSVDNLRLYDVALDPAGVLQLYNDAVPAYCVAVQRFGNSANVSQLNVSRPDTRGGFVPGIGELTLTVDAGPPTVMLTAPAVDNVYYKGSSGIPEIITIEGAAIDTESFVSKVEVDTGSGWQEADGLDSWVAQLTVTEEKMYTVRARATDAVGNVGPESVRSFIVDATPPTVGITLANGAIVVPSGNAQTGWTVPFSGPVADPVVGSSAGSGVAAVEVTVQSAATGQTYAAQKVELPGTTWGVSYQFPANLTDPSGAYTVTVTAEDKVGNRSAPLISTFELDITGPDVELSQLDQARLAIADTVTLNGVISDTGASGLNELQISFQPVEVVAAIPEETPTAQALAQVDWLAATLTNSGAGVANSTWSFAVPADLEGEYQINLRSTDTSNNVRLHPNVWRGIIDTQAPRVTIDAALAEPVDGVPDPIGGRQYFVEFTCRAVDRYLSEQDFDCPGNAIQEPLRSFNTDPLLQGIFPDRTILDTLENVYVSVEASQQPAATLTACDAFGHCNSATTGQVVAASEPGARTAAYTAGAPLAAVISPLQGRYVASDGTVPVTVVAEAGAGLESITLSLDGALVETITFAPGETVTSIQRTIPVAVSGEQVHTLVARAEDRSGAVQQTLYPVSFTLDTQPPLVTINTDSLGLAQTWGAGSDVLRFRGTASDTVELAAVQIKIGDAPFVDVTFDGVDWFTALQVPDPEGKTLENVRVRATDRAGRITEVTETIGVDLSAGNAPETTITSQPPAPDSTTVEFSFAGTDNANNPLSAFDCRLDGGDFTSCDSPKQYADLSNGLHRFEVRAIDDDGFVDPTPAFVEWTVAGAGPSATIDLAQVPTNPTFSRDARFVVSGSADVASLECSLDGAAYAPCSGEESYSGLRDGQHTFQVRGLDAAGNAGAPSRYVWRVQNAPPVAENRSISTFLDTPIEITLTALDSDPVTFEIVGNPANGAVQFIAANIVRYTPDSGRSGPDAFSFRASDGQEFSEPGTVDILVDATTVAVALSYVYAERADDGMVYFMWETATETGNAGFNLYMTVDEGAPNLITQNLIPSSVIDSVAPVRYTYAAQVAGDAYFIEMVNVDGSSERYGPYELGVGYGKPSVVDPTEVVNPVYLPIISGP